MRSQVIDLPRGELEHEILGKTLGIALNGLVQAAGAHTIDRRQVAIENNPMTPQEKDRAGDALGGKGFCHKL